MFLYRLIYPTIIILAEEDISDDEIREEIYMIFDVATHSKNNK